MNKFKHSFGIGDPEMDDWWESEAQEADNQDDVGQFADGDIYDNLDDGFFRA